MLVDLKCHLWHVNVYFAGYGNRECKIQIKNANRESHGVEFGGSCKCKNEIY